MSEKIFACLLRLYPARFRQRYRSEAVQLLRDRLRDERGLLRKLRLWIDLLADLAWGLPQAYRNTYATAATAMAPSADGLPTFRLLSEEPLKPQSILMGSVLAVSALALFAFLMSHAPGYVPFSRSNARLRAAAAGPVSNPDVQTVAQKLDAESRAAMALQECGFDKIGLLPGNVGYVKLGWFADLSTCRSAAEDVMGRLNATDAVIFDLRDCKGGYPEMVRFMASSLFDRPVAWYNPRATSRAELVTESPVPGSRLAGKPVFVLTSSRTFSGAEHFAYDLKLMRRATIVGERTSGASHALPGAARRIANPGPKPAWEGSGVQPDVRVKAVDAMETAEKLAVAAPHRN